MRRFMIGTLEWARAEDYVQWLATASPLIPAMHRHRIPVPAPCRSGGLTDGGFAQSGRRQYGAGRISNRNPLYTLEKARMLAEGWQGA